MNGPQKLLLAGTIAVGLPLVFLTPPFASADEPAHFSRAWAVSEGRLVAERDEVGGYGAWLPDAVTRLQWATGDFMFPGKVRFSWSALAPAWAIPRQGTDWRFQDFRNALQIPVLVYLPQAAACSVARVVELRPLATFYLARLANLALATALLCWALGRLPGFRWWLAALALTPMSLALRASVSPDALGFAIACAWCAEIAAIRAAAETPDRGSRIRLLLLAVGCGLTKPVYLPLLLLAFLVSEGRDFRSIARAALPPVLAGALASLAHLSTLESVRMRWDVEMSHPEIQLQRLLESPLAVAQSALSDLFVHAPRFVAEALGHKLGWLDLPVPPLLIVLALAGLVCVAWTESRQAPRWKGADLGLIAAAAVASALLVELALWIQWTPPELSGVEGVQGRYFLPLALPIVWLIGAGLRQIDRPPWFAHREADLAIAVASVSGIGAVLAVVSGYWF